MILSFSCLWLLFCMPAKRVARCFRSKHDQQIREFMMHNDMAKLNERLGPDFFFPHRDVFACPKKFKLPWFMPKPNNRDLTWITDWNKYFPKRPTDQELKWISDFYAEYC